MNNDDREVGITQKISSTRNRNQYHIPLNYGEDQNNQSYSYSNQLGQSNRRNSNLVGHRRNFSNVEEDSEYSPTSKNHKKQKLSMYSGSFKDQSDYAISERTKRINNFMVRFKDEENPLTNKNPFQSTNKEFCKVITTKESNSSKKEECKEELKPSIELDNIDPKNDIPILSQNKVFDSVLQIDRERDKNKQKISHKNTLMSRDTPNFLDDEDYQEEEMTKGKQGLDKSYEIGPKKGNNSSFNGSKRQIGDKLSKFRPAPINSPLKNSVDQKKPLNKLKNMKTSKVLLK